jgi:hypothetical protein
MAIDTCVEKFSGAVRETLDASTPTYRSRDDLRLPIPAGIQKEMRLKNRLWRQWQINSGPTLRAEVNHLQTSVTNRWRLVERPVGRYTWIPKPRRRVAEEGDQTGD